MIGKQFFLNAREGCFKEIETPGQHIHHFSELHGHLVQVLFFETKRGETLRLHIVNDVDFFVVSMFVNSWICEAFMNSAGNIDIHSPMKFTMSLDNGKNIFKVHQNGNSVRWVWPLSKLPSDDKERRDFLSDNLVKNFLPSLKLKRNPFPSHLIYKPFGTGNKIAGDYFGNGVHTKHNPVSNREVEAAGFSSRHSYISRHIHRK